MTSSLHPPGAELAGEEGQSQRHEEQIEPAERKILRKARHSSVADQEVREAEARCPSQRIVVPRQADVVLHDVGVERGRVQRGHRSHHHHEHARGGEKRKGEPAELLRVQQPAQRGHGSPGAGGRAERHHQAREQERRERPGELLGGAGQPQARARGQPLAAPRQQHGAEQDGDEDHVVRTEDLLPPGEGVEGGHPRGSQPRLVPIGQAIRQDDGEGIEGQGHDARVEEAEERARGQVAGEHDGACPGR